MAVAIAASFSISIGAELSQLVLGLVAAGQLQAVHLVQQWRQTNSVIEGARFCQATRWASGGRCWPCCRCCLCACSVDVAAVVALAVRGCDQKLGLAALVECACDWRLVMPVVTEGCLRPAAHGVAAVWVGVVLLQMPMLLLQRRCERLA